MTNWTDEEKKTIWKKAELYANEGKANEMRKDQEGALMK